MLLLVGAGCSPAATPTPTPNPPPVATESIGSTCAADDSCPNGLTCVKYFGIAGPNGPEFKSCEIPCSAGAACPQGLSCVTIADGPGQVCRAP